MRHIQNTIAIVLCLTTSAAFGADWFEALKAKDDDRALYAVLAAMPKGADLHNHNSGSIYPEWWLANALASEAQGYRYFTKVRINNCRPFDRRDDTYHLLFRNIDQLDYDGLDDCERGEFVALSAMNDEQRAGWLSSIKLDHNGEGRDEFFQKHWQRLDALLFNPYIREQNLALNLQSLAAEGAIYAEIMVGVMGAREADGAPISPQRMIDRFRDRLLQPDIVETGMTVRLQLTLLRFVDDAEDNLRNLYRLAAKNSDIIAAVNLVGREDNDKGHPRRFLSTLRELRQQYDVGLAIHAGEVDEPNDHVRDTLLLGASRIGHGLNLITDDEVMLLMRNGPYLVEINLISNLLLEYVVDYSQHPFPEYLRTDIPVALSTDDRGMWDSTLTDEFFVAVKEYNLSWREVKKLHVNSLTHAFVDEDVKQRLIDRHTQQMQRFEARIQRDGLENPESLPDTRTFICARYQLCD
ncbi:MAG: adenosine deaminase [Pseudomonadota bacterium]